jgi:hypothetical protein
VVNVAALDFTTTQEGGGGDVWIGARWGKAEVATVDEVAVRETEIRGVGDDVQVSPSVPALATQQSRCDGKAQARRSSVAEH